ncbi:MAG: hypothetical protein GX589_01825 [Deltaproteobacteria bacterium]|nr:hypothetical protein [Deltaproteobacteria bacterium]
MRRAASLRKFRSRKNMAGASMVEFAILVPVFYLTIMGLFGLSFRWGQVFLLEDALRSTARMVNFADQESLSGCHSQAEEYFSERMRKLGVQYEDFKLSASSSTSKPSDPDLFVSASIPPCSYCFLFGKKSVQRRYPVYLEDTGACY